MDNETPRLVDQNGLKTGQALTIGLLILAFVLDFWPLVAFVALAQLAGAAALAFAPYRLIYRWLILPLGLVKPDPQPDNPEPHRFALLVGATFSSTASVALLAGAPVVGWGLVWIVIALANLNFWLSFCLGCWVYYRLNRLGVPGFGTAPIQE